MADPNITTDPSGSVPSTTEDKNMKSETSKSTGIPPESEPYTFSKLDLVLLVFSLCTYLADIGSDIWVAILHHRNGDLNWFILTILFVCLPCILLAAYLLNKCLKECSSEISIHLLAVAIPGGYVYFFITSMYKGVQSMREKDPQKKQILLKELISGVSVSAFYRLFEAFLEAAPQLILQLYIKFNSPPNTNYLMVSVQAASVVTSLASLSWGIASHYKSDRLKEYGQKVSFCGVICIFLWRLFTVAARVLSIALFASFAAGGLVFLWFHFIIMLFWVRMQCKLKSCKLKFKDWFDGSLLKAFVLVFCCLNLPKQGHTRLGYALYYALVYTENVGMLLTWYFLKESQLWLKYLACVVIIGGFFIGIFFQVIYYLEFHPNNSRKDPEHPPIRKWVPCSDMGLILRDLSDKEIQEIERQMQPFVNGLSDAEMKKCKSDIMKKLQNFRGGELKAKTKEIIPLYFRKLKSESLQSVSLSIL